MTDRPRAGRLTPPGAAVTIGGATATFLASLGFLAHQVRAGDDPAIGPARTTVAAAAPKERSRPVVIRRRVVITRVVEDPPETSVAGPAPLTPSAPAVRTSAPAPAPAPVAAPAPAPAPAPTPAPVVSRAS